MSLKWLLLVALVALLSIGTGSLAQPRRSNVRARPAVDQQVRLQRLNAKYYAIQQDEEDGDDILEHEEDLVDDSEDAEGDDIKDGEDGEEEDESTEAEKENQKLDTKKVTANSTPAKPKTEVKHQLARREESIDELQNLKEPELEQEIKLARAEPRNRRRGGRRNSNRGRRGRGSSKRRSGNRRCGGRRKRGQRKRSPSKRSGNKRRTGSKTKGQGQKNKTVAKKEAVAPSNKVA
ncbi:zinc finger Ran-binding domain-containing protein 2 [Drosophila erecta]|uniref:Uncharacterized protein n=1 Tax=Drosophila erecta TaxID=7220 RepID=B3N8S8_DROER|nr:zinc finger Ran-binding domain-containing protein 2 [Drosophila erecta]EDV59555.1 uncharacterized protein Dere_GG10664 [Drosophila erecta]